MNDGPSCLYGRPLHIAEPERAYFGQKDGQQVVVIRRMARDLDFPVEIVVVPTVREPDGLAISSRNAYLSRTERAAAPILYRALRHAQELFERGERDATLLRSAMREMVTSENLAVVDYISIANTVTLEESVHADSGAMASLAVRIGQTRLIDNVLLSSE